MEGFALSLMELCKCCANRVVLCTHISGFHQAQYDTHNPEGHCSLVIPFLMKRTKVVEIVAARDIVFSLTQSGVCAAFSRGNTWKKFRFSLGYQLHLNLIILILLLLSAFFSPFWAAVVNRRVCFMNISPDEVIRSLFYNKNNDSLITVSVFASDNFSSLRCRSTRIECVPLSLYVVLCHANSKLI